MNDIQCCRRQYLVSTLDTHSETFSDIPLRLRMATDAGDDSLYPIAVLIDELRNEDVQVWVAELNWNLTHHILVETELHQEAVYNRPCSWR